MYLEAPSVEWHKRNRRELHRVCVTEVLMINRHIPTVVNVSHCSQGEYEIYLAECGAFVFYGMERFLGYIPPHKVAATNMPGGCTDQGGMSLFLHFGMETGIVV